MSERRRVPGETRAVGGHAFITDHDLHRLAAGTHYRAYEKLGAHPWKQEGVTGVHFAVIAPSAERVSVIGEFNEWDPNATPLARCHDSGLWCGFVANVGPGALYKYRVNSRCENYSADKADPFGFAAEVRPQTASKVWDLSRYRWGDDSWMRNRGHHNAHDAPISIYEVHLGSWMRVPKEDNRWLTYRELAERLTDYVRTTGFTHVELLPITEHPFDGSWGYQTVGHYAPTSRFGLPDDFMFFVDTLHQANIGVLLDWVPSHFPSDEHGLGYFDGTHLYEHADPRQRTHPDWNTLVFNYGRWETRSFLISNAIFWLDRYHIDGFRVDAVSSMLYLDYGRRDGEWIPNDQGGKNNLEAIRFLRTFNERVYGEYPDILTVAEESTAWPMVSRPTYLGGLGFGFKWNMGWMHDSLAYFSKDPNHRSYHHKQLTFGLMYAFAENFILPFSHDEVVHGKGSMIGKMPGNEWQQFANLRALYGFMFGYPGKKLLFMGSEFGQLREWNHDASLDWHLLDLPRHRGLQRWVRALNTFYRAQPALHEIDFDGAGFEWIDNTDYRRSVLSFLRKAKDPQDCIVFACDFAQAPLGNYQLGVPTSGIWTEALNSDATLYGGSGQGNLGRLEAVSVPCHGQPNSLTITLPPLTVLAFTPEAAGTRAP